MQDHKDHLQEHVDSEVSRIQIEAQVKDPAKVEEHQSQDVPRHDVLGVLKVNFHIIEPIHELVLVFLSC